VTKVTTFSKTFYLFYLSCFSKNKLEKAVTFVTINNNNTHVARAGPLARPGH